MNLKGFHHCYPLLLLKLELCHWANSQSWSFEYIKSIVIRVAFALFCGLQIELRILTSVLRWNRRTPSISRPEEILYFGRHGHVYRGYRLS